MQEATTRRLLAHCGIPWQDSVLSFHETQRMVATASLAQVVWGCWALAPHAAMRSSSVVGCVAWPRRCIIGPGQASLATHTSLMPAHAASQVRQRLYSSSVGRWRRYARQLAPLLRPLRQLMLRYERQAGLDSSEQLLAEVLDGPSRESGSGSGSGGDGSGGSGGSGGSRTSNSEGGSDHAQAGSAIKDEL